MYLKIDKRANGRVNLAIFKSYRDPVSKKVRTKSIKNLGYLDELEKIYDNPIEHFKIVAKNMTDEENLLNAPISFKFDSNEIVADSNNRKNLGFTILSFFYHKLGIDVFWNNRQKSSKSKFNLNQIFKSLVYLRALEPASKRATFNSLGNYFFDYDFSIHDIYRALSKFSSYKDDLCAYIHQSIVAEYGRDTSKVFYDVTNFYFEIDYEDEIRKKGVSKEYRPNPIIQMGLLMDNNSIPISFNLFEGNINDSKTFKPSISKLKDDFNFNRIVVVADKGMYSGNNMVYNCLNNDGYIFSQSVRKANKELKDFILSNDGYEYLSDDFKIKSRIIPTDVNVRLKNGRLKKVKIDQKQVVYWSRKYADRQKFLRESSISKADNLIDKGITKPYNSSYSYIQTRFIDFETGEYIDEFALNNIDKEKIKNEEMFDGYYLIVTSELDMSDKEIIESYRSLSKIEESFKITKSNLEARPVFVSRKDRINSHFLTCFVTLTLLRLLELAIKDKDISLNQAILEMKNINASHLKENYYIFDRNNEIVRGLGNIVGIDFTKKIRSLKEIKSIISYVK